MWIYTGSPVCAAVHTLGKRDTGATYGSSSGVLKILKISNTTSNTYNVLLCLIYLIVMTDDK